MIWRLKWVYNSFSVSHFYKPANYWLFYGDNLKLALCGSFYSGNKWKLFSWQNAVPMKWRPLLDRHCSDAFGGSLDFLIKQTKEEMRTYRFSGKHAKSSKIMQRFKKLVCVKLSRHLLSDSKATALSWVTKRRLPPFKYCRHSWRRNKKRFKGGKTPVKFFLPLVCTYFTLLINFHG